MTAFPLGMVCLLLAFGFLSACGGGGAGSDSTRLGSRATITGKVVLVDLDGLNDLSRVKIDIGRGEGGVPPYAAGTFRLGDLEPDVYNLVITYAGGINPKARSSAYKSYQKTIDARGGSVTDLGDIHLELVIGGLVWVSIPSGSFEMGCSLNDSNCSDAEKPRHSVTVPAFKMTETEITQAQYQAVIGENPSSFTSCGGDCPVDSVTWDQAKMFCEAAGGRLPSEAEWEYAARAGTTTIYYCGDDSACLDGIAWYDANSDGKTHAVKGKTANAFGLYDMLGNVWEWNADCWHDTYDGAPADGSVWDSEQCSFRILRGGGWYSLNIVYLRSSGRYNLNPDIINYLYLGFRCSRD